ncbi:MULTISPECIES: hypothetical protein [unclassified Corynebacterium]|uniref:hypothetical protein n=1 Tax=unclassified Corynebacterium TaxID=2624378 RepID=UPI003096F3DA
MDHYDARLRLREVTQELFDIGDEVAEYINNLSQAIADVDRDLVDECVLELADIVDEAVEDARPLVGELAGLRQAFTSGIRRGEFSPFHLRPAEAAPVAIDVERLNAIPTPLQHPVPVPAVTEAMAARSDAVATYLDELADWLSAENIRGVENLGAVMLPHLYAHCGRRALSAAASWCVTVPETHPAVARTLRGRKPPAFLIERSRIDDVVRRINQKRAARQTMEHA